MAEKKPKVSLEELRKQHDSLYEEYEKQKQHLVALYEKPLAQSKDAVALVKLAESLHALYERYFTCVVQPGYPSLLYAKLHIKQLKPCPEQVVDKNEWIYHIELFDNTLRSMRNIFEIAVVKEYCKGYLAGYEACRAENRQGSGASDMDSLRMLFRG